MDRNRVARDFASRHETYIERRVISSQYTAGVDNVEAFQATASEEWPKGGFGSIEPG